MTPEIKQFGLHRSGTNFLRVILQENFRVRVLSNEGGWKHGHYEVPQRLGHELDCAICIKNPYAWLVSLHRYRHPENDLSFAEFVRGPITLTGPEGTIEKPNPVRLWVEMHEHWLSINLKAHRLFVFLYEKILSDPAGSVAELASSLGLQRRIGWKFRLKSALGLARGSAPLYVPPRQLGPLRDHYRKKNLRSGKSFDAGYYGGREYLKAFDPGLLDFVNSNLDAGVMTYLGYALLESREMETTVGLTDASAHQPQRGVGLRAGIGGLTPWCGALAALQELCAGLV